MIFGLFVVWAMMSRNRAFEDKLLILHRIKYQENNLLLDGYSHNHGRIRLLVKGARVGKSKSAIQPFQLFSANWIGCGELKTLTQRELLQTLSLKGAALYCGFYLNELLMRATPLEVTSQNLFELYLQTLQGLVAVESQQQQELLLRQFEWGLLMDLGYAFSLTEDESGSPIQPNKYYTFVENQGLVSDQFLTRKNNYIKLVHFSGDDLLALSQWRLASPETMRVAKNLMRMALLSVLGERPLKTRLLYKQMVR